MTKTGPEGSKSVQWDPQRREELAKKEGHIRDDVMFLTHGLLNWMENEWGGVITHVKISTFVETGEVWVTKAGSGEPGATYLRRGRTLNSGEFSFWRPLHKLQLKVPPHQQYNVTPYAKEVEGVGTVFVFPMNDRVSVPRNRKEEKAAAKAAKLTAEQAATSVSE